jgi:hypothetical protein
MPGYVIRHSAWSNTADGKALGLFVMSSDGAVRLMEAVFSASTVIMDEIHKRLRSVDENADEDFCRKAVTAMAVQKLERLISMDAVDPIANRLLPIQIEDADIATIVETAGFKSCKYREADQRGDCLCAAADHFGVSLAVCRECMVPDSVALCSHFTHPQMSFRHSIGLAINSTVPHALCNRGRDDVQSVEGCTVGGHACWERIVEVTIDAPSGAVSPVAIAEGLDHLNAVWRLAFGKNSPLLNIKTATSIALLSQPCATRSDFVQGTSALDDALKYVAIDDPLLDPKDLGTPNIAFSLNRLTSCLRFKLAAADWPTAEKGILTLRRINKIRVGLQHSGAMDELWANVAALGAPTKPEWPVLWRTVCARTVEALAQIRSAVQTLV